jgi:hypothetical protein
MATACFWGVESGKLMYPSSRSSSTYPRCTVGGKMSNKKLEQRIYIKFCVKVSRSAGETALLTLAYGEYAMKTFNVF